jgi:threonine dehydrogenase-like Zn-dependent dehydrogenase
MDSAFEDWLMSSTSGEGIPVVFEATGVPDVVSLGFNFVASGGRLVVLGLVPEGTRLALSGLDITRKEATILGSRASTGCFPEALRLLASGLISYPCVASELPMWDAPDIMRRLAESPRETHHPMHKVVMAP